MISYLTRLAAGVAVMATLLSSHVGAAETESSVRLSKRSQSAAATARGDFSRAGTWSRQNFSKAHAFSADRESMSTSSSIAVRTRDGKVRGTGFNLTIGRSGSSRGTAISRSNGSDAAVWINGRTNSRLIEARAHARGQLAKALSRLRSFSN